MPYAMAGDPKQLDPAVMSLSDAVNWGVHCNRHGPDGRISILEFLDARANTGIEQKRTRHIFTGLVVPDLLYVKSDITYNFDTVAN